MEIQASGATTVASIASMVGGRVVGDPAIEIRAALPLQDAEPGCLTLVDSGKNADRFMSGPAAAALVTTEMVGCPKTQIVVGNLHAAFRQVMLNFRPEREQLAGGVHPTSVVDVSSKIGTGSSIANHVTIEADVTIGARCKIHSGVHIMAGTTIGDDCVIYPRVTIYGDTRIGSRVTIHAGAVLGADGFGYKTIDGEHVRASQLGWVQVGDDVEVGANTCIDRGTYGATKIGSGTKLDNMVQIGHNVQIGEHNLICAQVGIAGSSTTGNYVIMAGQVGVADHITIGEKVILGGQAGVLGNLAPGATYFGSPAAPRKQRLIEVALTSKLPQFRTTLKSLQKQVQELQAKLTASSGDETGDESQIEDNSLRDAA